MCAIHCSFQQCIFGQPTWIYPCTILGALPPVETLEEPSHVIWGQLQTRETYWPMHPWRWMPNVQGRGLRMVNIQYVCPRRNNNRCAGLQVPLRHNPWKVHEVSHCLSPLPINFFGFLSNMLTIRVHILLIKWFYVSLRIILHWASLPNPKVRKQVERVVAQLAAWSISWSSRGLAPMVGFHGEPFEKGSTRYAMRGKEMAKGFRTLSATIVFLVLLNVLWKCNPEDGKTSHIFFLWVYLGMRGLFTP